jgi:hypothetical protein
MCSQLPLCLVHLILSILFILSAFPLVWSRMAECLKTRRAKGPVSVYNRDCTVAVHGS